jgi:hypothetical protein
VRCDDPDRINGMNMIFFPAGIRAKKPFYLKKRYQFGIVTSPDYWAAGVSI